MPKQTKAAIKAQFQTGKTPTYSDYADWIDSFVHLDDQQAVDSQIVSQLLVTYDQNLKTRNQNGPIDTLGDVLYFLADIQDNTKLTDTIAKIDWTKLPNKPSTVLLQIDEQYVVTDVTKFDPQPRDTPIPGVSTVTNPSTRSVLSIGAINTPGNVITNITITRQWVSIPTGGTPVTFYTDIIAGVTVCVTPKAKLT